MPYTARWLWDQVEVIFCKYRCIHKHKKNPDQKLLFFHEEILISIFGLSRSAGNLPRYLMNANKNLTWSHNQRGDFFYVWIFLVCITIKLLSPDVGTKDPGFVRFMTRSHRTEIFM